MSQYQNPTQNQTTIASMNRNDTNAPKIVISLAALTGLSLVFMSLRFFCKTRYHKKIGVDDYMLAASWICLLVFASLSIVSTHFGIGEHIVNISLADRVIALQLLYIGRFFGIIALAISKTSFATTLLHLAMVPWQRHLIWFIIITLNLVLWLSALSLFVQCTPINKAWDLNAPGSCWPSFISVDIGIGAGAYSAGMDFTLALFPTFLIWRLQMETREKVGVILAMSLGVLAGVTAGIKTSYITGSGRSVDFTFTTTNLLIWSGAESAVTIIAASIPFLRLVLREVSSKIRTPQLDVNYINKSGSAGTANRALVGTSTLARQQDEESDDGIFNEEKHGRVVFSEGKAKIQFN